MTITNKNNKYAIELTATCALYALLYLLSLAVCATVAAILLLARQKKQKN